MEPRHSVSGELLGYQPPLLATTSADESARAQEAVAAGRERWSGLLARVRQREGRVDTISLRHAQLVFVNNYGGSSAALHRAL